MKKIIIAATLLVLSTPSWGDDRSFQQSKNLEIFNSLYKEVDLFFVDTIQPEKFIRTGIDAMLQSLDPYTEYIPENDLGTLRLITTGEYGGIGALIMLRDKRVSISDVYDNMPAAEAGLQPGDIFLRIDSTDVRTKTDKEVRDLLQGQANTPIRIEVERPGVEGTVVKEFLRRKVVISTVPHYGVYGTKSGYIRLTNFTDKSAQEVKNAFLDLKKNHQIESLILDLRDNPGGVMETAIQIVNFFVPKGSQILMTKGKIRQYDREYRATLEPLDTRIPLAVLINRSSASSAEIVSGALQDLDRAVVLGSRSYGKGLVQSPRPLPYNGAVKITTAKYYTPSGRCIQAIDYSHRDADNRAEAIPDSLTKEFSTLNGRTVRDGGGVTPDIKLDPPKSPNILYYLARDYLVFDYATRFVLAHKEIAPADSFELTDAQYDEFKQLVKSKNFTYDRQSEKMMKELREMMTFEGYYDNAKEQFAALEATLNHNIDRDLDIFKEEIKELIQIEICKRYYRTRGEIKQALRRDAEFQETLRRMTDLPTFVKTLQPTAKQ